MNNGAIPLRVMIVDDEEPARIRLREILSDCAGDFPAVVVGEAANGREALEQLAHDPPDAVLLDIRMPEMDGIELARHLLKMPQPPAVIFTTAYDDHAIEAFELNAIDYLLKPIRAERLANALRKARAIAPAGAEALRQLAPAPRTNLSVYERGKILLIPLEDVVYLKAELKYVTIRAPDREYLLEESLSHLEQEFGAHFVRIHRNCLVARARIAGFGHAPRQEQEGESGSGWVVLLKGVEEALPVSRRQHHVIKELLG